MGFRGKLATVILINALVMIIMVNVGMYYQGREGENAIKLGSNNRSLVIAEIAVKFKLMVQEWKNLLLRGKKPESYAKYVKSMIKFKSELGERIAEAKKGGSDEEINELAKLQTAIDTLFDRYQAAREAYLKPDEFDSSKADHDVNGLDRPVDSQIDKLTNVAQEKMKQTLQENLDNISRSQKFVITATSITSILLCILIHFFVTSRMSRDLTSASKNLKHSTEGLDHNSSELKTASQSVAQSVGEQADAVKETAASMAEIIGMLTQTVNFASRAEIASGEARDNIRSGSEVVRTLIQAMQEIAEANSRLRDLEKMFVEISNKSRVINDLAFKTDRLSGNAAIEASRAGHSGRGFAVVAQEVGALSLLSADSAKEINGLLKKSRDQVATLVSLTEKRVDAGKSVTEAVNSSFHAIAQSIEQIAASIDRIKTAASEQEIGVQQTSAAIVRISDATERNRSLAKDVAHTADHVNDQVGTLARVNNSLAALTFGRFERKRLKKSA